VVRFGIATIIINIFIYVYFYIYIYIYICIYNRSMRSVSSLCACNATCMTVKSVYTRNVHSVRRDIN